MSGRLRPCDYSTVGFSRTVRRVYALVVLVLQGDLGVLRERCTILATDGTFCYIVSTLQYVQFVLPTWGRIINLRDLKQHARVSHMYYNITQCCRYIITYSHLSCQLAFSELKHYSHLSGAHSINGCPDVENGCKLLISRRSPQTTFSALTLWT